MSDTDSFSYTESIPEKFKPDPDTIAVKYSHLVTNEIDKALFEIQKDVIPLHGDEKNPFFKSNYISLTQLKNAVYPILIKHGVLIKQRPVFHDGVDFLQTTLTHVESSQFFQGEMRLNPIKNDPQGLGSANSYARRYSLMTMLGISEKKGDDDGQYASHPQPTQPQSTKPRNTRGPSEKQMNRWHAIAKANGYSNELQKEILMGVFGYSGSRKDLGYDIYNKATKYMEDHPNEGDTDSSYPPNGYDEKRI